MKVITTLEGEAITVNLDGSITFMCKAHIDADGSGGNPQHDPDFQAETSLKRPDGQSLNAYLEPFMVVPPAILNGVPGVVLGCLAHVLWQRKCIAVVVGDIGPATKLGEISVAAAKALGMNASPLNGGVDDHVVHFIIWPDWPAPGYNLQPHNK